MLLQMYRIMLKARKICPIIAKSPVAHQRCEGLCGRRTHVHTVLEDLAGLKTLPHSPPVNFASFDRWRMGAVTGFAC